MNRSAAVSFLSALLLVSQPRPARAVVRTAASSGAPLAWRESCPLLTLDAVENPDIPSQRMRAALERAAADWNRPAAPCSSPRFSVESSSVAGRDVSLDGVNLVLWRLPGHCQDPSHRMDDLCLAPDSVALTSVFYTDDPGSPDDGHLIEADVELNGFAFSFSDSGDAARMDLESALSHELGHVLGLAHTCASGAGGPPATDDAGRPVPPCYPASALDSDARLATMYPFAAPGELARRQPRPNEVSGLCSAYGARPPGCAPPSAAGCRVAAPERDGAFRAPALALLIALALILSMRRV